MFRIELNHLDRKNVAIESFAIIYGRQLEFMHVLDINNDIVLTTIYVFGLTERLPKGSYSTDAPESARCSFSAGRKINKRVGSFVSIECDNK